MNITFEKLYIDGILMAHKWYIYNKNEYCADNQTKDEK